MKLEIDFNDLEKHRDKIIVRKYKDMKDVFQEKLSKDNPVIYKVFIKDYKDFEEGLTVINPGSIDGEYYMTKGHKHSRISPEIYILISGKGKLLISVNKKEKLINMKKGKVYYIPGNSGHRLINIGSKELKVMTIYGKNAGHNYNFKFNKRVRK